MTMRPVCSLGIFLAAVCFAGCGGGGGSAATIDPGPLSGVIDGKPWTLGTAETNAFLSADGSDFFVEAYGEKFEACAGNGSFDVNSLILTVPKTAGDYPINLSRIQTFYIAATAKNLGATSGRLVVDSVTDTTLTGSAVFQYDANNKVSGHFQATICSTK